MTAGSWKPRFVCKDIMVDAEKWMRIALEWAGKAAAIEEVPVGAVLVAGDSIVAADCNRVESLRDAAAHAEMLALKSASRKLGKRRLTGLSLFVTLEPCPMCAMASILARIDAVYFGARDVKFGAAGSVINVFEEGLFNHRVRIHSGIMSEESAELLRGFFRRRRIERDAVKKGS